MIDYLAIHASLEIRVMQAQEIRDKFTNFFKKANHKKHDSSSLIPHNDPTLLFANAGMNQFKDYFTGKAQADNKRATTIQKCVRAGGKHNDLENVGPSPRHHTFFEMLGNFSFGDYFKKDAIKFAWDFLTEELKMDKDRLYITIHNSDDEASEIWNKEIGIPLERISRKGDKDNFWEMGEFGPCGPSSEIFYDHGEKYATPGFIPKEGQDFLDDEARYIEIWNLVFMQFEKTKEGKFPLPKPSIDTGAGLERIAAAMQGKYWNYDSDIFAPIIEAIEKVSRKSYSDEKYSSSIRVVADHIRSCTMLITDGVIPSNEGRGYVLRRIIRRAILHLKKLDAPKISFYKLVPTVFETLGKEYPQNASNISLAETMLQLEEKKFLETLDHGLKFLDEALVKDVENGILKGESVFKLYDTYGFPVDLTQTILEEKNLQVDSAGFHTIMEKRKAESRKSWKGGQAVDNQVFFELKEKVGTTKFIGYEDRKTKAKLLAKKEIGDITALIFDETPFYAESGGQLGDSGYIKIDNNVISEIFDTVKPVENLFVHYSKNADNLEVGEKYKIEVNNQKRDLTSRNHTATHLLQAALIEVLGDHVKQSGSSVSHDKLRFDFTNPKVVTKEELKKIEKIVNDKIKEGLKVKTEILNQSEAIEKGALALFGEKYGEKVRVLKISDFSMELCGGTHVKRTSEIEHFSITSEAALSSGIRRIEAVSSSFAIERLQERSNILESVEEILTLNGRDVPERIEKFMVDLKTRQKEINELSDKIGQLEGGQLFENHEQLSDSITFKHAKAPKGGDLRKLSDIFYNKFPKGILLLTGEKNNKLSVLLRRPKDLKNIDCGAILKKSLQIINGKGGGRSDFAQGSGDNTSLDKLINDIREQLRGTI